MLTNRENLVAVHTHTHTHTHTQVNINKIIKDKYKKKDSLYIFSSLKI